MSGLQDKVAIVTGSTGGIGRAIARKLAAEGAKVVINGRTPASGKVVVDQIQADGGEAVFMQGDVLSKDQMPDLVDRAVERFGQIDIMVASAGGSVAQPDDRPRSGYSFFHQVDPEDIAASVARSTLG